MKLTDRIKQKSLNNTGFDNSTSNSSGRAITLEGRFNVKRTGIPFFERISIYHSLINMKPSHFLLFVLGIYLFINLIFAIIYYIIGIQYLGGTNVNASCSNAFAECFFFSAQTLTTVGYGVLHPTNIITNVISSFESLFGWMAFAVLTGLLYGRFSRPKAYLKFSENALITPYKEVTALMFRLAPFKNTQLTEAEVTINISYRIEENGKLVTKFFTLKPQVEKINLLSLNWTVVHLIDDSSPLWNMTQDEIIENQTEILIFFKAFDEHFSNTVKQNYSYTAKEIVFNAKFDIMFKRSDDNQYTILELDKINDYRPA